MPKSKKIQEIKLYTAYNLKDLNGFIKECKINKKDIVNIIRNDSPIYGDQIMLDLYYWG
jgi:hypothetical protein